MRGEGGGGDNVVVAPRRGYKAILLALGWSIEEANPVLTDILCYQIGPIGDAIIDSSSHNNG